MTVALVPVEHAAFGSPTPSPKALGAYYTDQRVAHFLLRWAVRSPSDTVLDPSFGGGVFLTAARQRITELGGNPDRQVHGIELDHTAFSAIAFESRSGIDAELVNANFFEIQPDSFPAVAAVVGNPPFIRYQRFNGPMREAALRSAQETGVNVSRLASSWAPFIVHAARFLRPGGRLAMVAPAEVAYATYAQALLQHLRRTFGSITLVGFTKRLFPQLSEDTVLVLADEKGGRFSGLHFTEVTDVDSLLGSTGPLDDAVPIDMESFARGTVRLPQYLISPSTRDLYFELARTAEVTRLGRLARVGIGYVTGDNAFFHVDQKTTNEYRLPPEALRPAARTLSDFEGVHFTSADWQVLHEAGRANMLLGLRAAVPEGVSSYLMEGVRRGVPSRFKCRVRDPWYAVPNVYVGEALLTYMSGHRAKFVVNQAGVVSPNTLHVARFLPGREASAEAVAVAWRTSLSALSTELEGHALGGGLLKLEPAEARRVLLPMPNLDPLAINDIAAELDTLERNGEVEAARACADRRILREALGLSDSQIQDIQTAWRTVRDRRITR